MKTLISFSAIILMCYCSFSQTANQAHAIVTKDNYGSISTVKFPHSFPQNQLPKTSQEFFDKYLNLSEGQEFKKFKTNYIKEGLYNEMYNQYYKGILVESSGLTLFYKFGKLNGADGRYVNIKDFNIIPAVAPE